MACMGCGSKTLTPKKPQLAANNVRPMPQPTATRLSVGKMTFGTPKINRAVSK